MSNLKPLVWHKDAKKWQAYGAGICYTIIGFDSVINVTINNLVKRDKDEPRSSDSKTFTSYSAALEFVEHEHYPHFMSEFVKPDSITDIANWFKAAKPEPTAKDALVQQGCHFEEVVEHLTSIGIESEDLCDLSNDLKSNTRLQTDDAIANYMDTIDNLELLDALCDQIVTATGVGYMMGFDIEGALKEVIRSNNSKMVNGKFEFDANGKIMKAKGYSKPDLTPFVKQGE